MSPSDRDILTQIYRNWKAIEHLLKKAIQNGLDKKEIEPPKPNPVQFHILRDYLCHACKTNWTSTAVDDSCPKCHRRMATCIERNAEV